MHPRSVGGLQCPRNCGGINPMNSVASLTVPRIFFFPLGHITYHRGNSKCTLLAQRWVQQYSFPAGDDITTDHMNTEQGVDLPTRFPPFRQLKRGKKNPCGSFIIPPSSSAATSSIYQTQKSSNSSNNSSDSLFLLAGVISGKLSWTGSNRFLPVQDQLLSLSSTL